LLQKDDSITSNKVYGTIIKTSSPNSATAIAATKIKSLDSSSITSAIKSTSKSTSSNNTVVSASAIANININNPKSFILDAQLANEIYKKSFESPGVYNPNIHVLLDTKPLWDKFASIGTEMIITKCGRYI
jgi:hypothetical protein